MGAKQLRSSAAGQALIDSFIVKIWRRNDPAGESPARWHGQITHVPSGERVYSDDSDELLIKVAMQLQRLGIALAPWWRFRLWLLKCKQFWKRKIY